MEVFWAEKIAAVEDQPSKQCHVCGEKLTHVRVIINCDTRAVIQMFECLCGERFWTD
jgi:hypothetical protein